MARDFSAGTGSAPLWLWTIPGAFVLAGLLVLLVVAPAHALPKDDDDGMPRPICQPDNYVAARLYISDGVHSGTDVVRTRPVTITAQSGKIVSLAGDCSIVLYPLPASEYSWQLAKPKFSLPSFVTDGLNAKLTPDQLGAYTVRLVTCPGGCLVDNLSIEETTFSIALQSLEFLALPPATEPVVRSMTPTDPSNFPDSEIDEKCLYGGGVTDPQWVTVDQWNGPQDYELLEGPVHKSRISRKDNPLNHHSQDFLFHVEPDPAYRRLVNGSRTYVEVEWERSHLFEIFRPTSGDRVSVIGYWILDCGHGGPTEIHPPLMIATHRARPVLIPSTQKFPLPKDTNDDVVPTVQETIGTGVYVPGIVTDLLVNAHSGEITDNCSDTGLHQPGRFQPTPSGVLQITGDCIRGPSDIRRIYTFNIYLPKLPELTSNREVPLYFEVKDHPAGYDTGPEPTITRIDHPDNPYLQVTLDLRNFTGTRYARRIYAAWVLPSPENWGIQAWKVRLNSVEVHSDGDCNYCGRGDGDWRFWINVNNTLNEWTKLFDCSGCVHGTETFGGRPWQTGTTADTSPDRLLGPHVLRFPQQRIWVHTSGFEEDWAISDDTGSVSVLVPQETRSYNSRSLCSEQTVSDCADYTLHFDVLDGPAVAAPVLTGSAQKLFDDYLIKAKANGPIVDCYNCDGQSEAWYPYDDSLQPDDPPIDLDSTLHFRVQPSLEVSVTTDITLEDFGDHLTRTLEISPTKVYSFMQELREEVDQVLGPAGLIAAEGDGPHALKEKQEEVKADLLLWKPAFPRELWDEYFGDLEPLGPSINVTETASQLSVVTPGAQVTFTVQIGNDGDRTMTVTQQTSNLYGDITDPANPALLNTTCSAPQALAQGALVSCTFVAVAGGAPGQVLDSEVTVAATNEYSRAYTAADSLQIAITATGLTVASRVAGASPPAAWEYEGPSGLFTLPPAGGSKTFTTLVPGKYTVRQTIQNGYGVAVTCSDGSQGIDRVTVDLADGKQVTCTFTNTEGGAVYLPSVQTD